MGIGIREIGNRSFFTIPDSRFPIPLFGKEVFQSKLPVESTGEFFLPFSLWGRGLGG
jgi:hypothetical protein